MKKTKDEILSSLRSLIGEDEANDEALTLIEDISDTLEEQNSGEDWKSRFEENDKAWRKKYHDRFFSKPEEPEQDPDPMEPEEPEKLTFESLFTIKERN